MSLADKLSQRTVEPIVLSYWYGKSNIIYLEKTREFERKDFEFRYPSESNAVSFIHSANDNFWRYSEDYWGYKAAFLAEFKKEELRELFSGVDKYISFGIPKYKNQLKDKNQTLDYISEEDILIKNLEEAKEFWLSSEGHFIDQALKRLNRNIDSAINMKIGQTGFIVQPFVNDLKNHEGDK